MMRTIGPFSALLLSTDIHFMKILWQLAMTTTTEYARPTLLYTSQSTGTSMVWLRLTERSQVKTAHGNYQREFVYLVMTIWPTISRRQSSLGFRDLFNKSCMQSRTVCRLTILWITSTTKPAPCSNFNIEESYPGHTSILPTTFTYQAPLHLGLLWCYTVCFIYFYTFTNSSTWRHHVFGLSVPFNIYSTRHDISSFSGRIWMKLGTNITVHIMYPDAVYTSYQIVKTHKLTGKNAETSVDAFA